MSGEIQRKVGAKCRVCGQQLTVEEFRACSGIGHYCSSHLPASLVKARDAARPSRSSRPRTSSPKSPAPPGSSRRGRRVSPNGVTEYSCKGQFARKGEIRSGRLTTDHPSCSEGQAVFVYNDVGYGPGEVSTLFIRDPEGRELAQRVGFICHD
jgi:hypothetical protein